MRRSALLVTLVVALAGGVTACSDKTGGSAVPGDTTTQEPTGSGPTTSRSTSARPTSGNSPLAGKDPCTLLPAAGQAQLGISNGEKDEIGSARRCRWRLRGPQDTYFFSVLVYDELGIKDLPDGQLKDVPDVGKHKAVQRTDSGNPGTCAVIMGVSESSRVTTQVTAGTDTQKACELGSKLAELVEPELP